MKIKIIDKIKSLFKTDWQLVWENDKPVIHEFRQASGGDLENNLIKMYSYYKIYYSPSKRKCRLKLFGHNPKNHWFYITALRKLIFFRDLTNNYKIIRCRASMSDGECYHKDCPEKTGETCILPWHGDKDLRE